MAISDIPTQTLPDEGEIGFVHIGSLTTESGAVIDDVHIAVQRWGELSPTRDNVVVVLHALTGDSHITGPAGLGHPTGGWWDGMVGPGAPIDTDRWCAVATNVLGGCRGSTGPSSRTRDGKPWGSRFPRISIRDQVEADIAALAALGIDNVAAVVGGSMGGARALEWIVGHPNQVRAGLLLAVGARATADQIGTQSTQIAVIKADPNWRGGDYHDTGPTPDTGLAIARRFAHLTYRGEVDLDTRFANDGQSDEDPADGGRYAVQSYLEYQGDKLLERFDAGSYVVLTEALNSHDVGRGRGAEGPPVEILRHVASGRHDIEGGARTRGLESETHGFVVVDERHAGHALRLALRRLPGEDGNGFDMVRVGEEVQRIDPISLVTGLAEGREVARQRHRIAGDVDHAGGLEACDRPHHVAPRARPGRVEDDDPARQSLAVVGGCRSPRPVEPSVDARRLRAGTDPLREVLAGVVRRAGIRLHARHLRARSAERGERGGEQPHAAVEVEVPGIRIHRRAVGRRVEPCRHQGAEGLGG